MTIPTGIFPRNGLAPGVKNTGMPLAIQPEGGCVAAYYNEECPQRIDPIALNALISEFVSVFNACPEFVYDCSRRDNLLRALQCIDPENPEVNPCSAVYANMVAFGYTGADQDWVVPAGVTQIFVKGWGGAGGGGPGGGAYTNGAVSGGPGGFTSGVLAVTPGETLKIVVGIGGAIFTTASLPGAPEYGYGALPKIQPYLYPVSANDEGGSGGGIAGLFRGAPSQANALLIAGGGGGANDDETSPSLSGFAGNGAGGQAGMSGEAGSASALASAGGGGGGYFGGKTTTGTTGATGGTGFVHPDGLCATVLASTPGMNYPPNVGDADHGGVAGVVAQIPGGWSGIPGSSVRYNHARLVIRYN